MSEDGTDCRNYGVVDGIPEAKELIGSMVGAPADNVIVFGNSSLNIMFDTVSHAWTHGVCGNTPWSHQAAHGKGIRFLCPSPGYDRHFGVTEYFGIEMIPVEMTETGPDMDKVEELVSSDASIKGIWCVPMYSNPEGVVYSDETVRRFASLRPAAGDFRIFWDNAYCVHHLYDEHPVLLNILDEAIAAGNEDIFYEFCSTSKITFPGSGVSGLIASKANLDDIRSQMKSQTIGHDKINQLRHVRFLRDAEGVEAHMLKHAGIIRPKFEAVEEKLEQELAGKGIGRWTNPRGGYFISFDSLPGCARRIVSLAKEAGVTMTGAGATYPYHDDPQDRNIRIAPTLPTPEELTQAAEVFVLCVKLASVEKILDER
jgi:DNA-binding transcriptional MocR family regulator